MMGAGTRRFGWVLAFVLVAGSVAHAEQQTWKAGAAATRITPDKPLVLLGYPDRAGPFTSVAGDIWAKALAIEDPHGHKAVIVTADLVGFQAHTTTDPVCQRLMKRTGLPREEYFDHSQEPDPNWLKTIRVLLTVGENDKGHWVKGEKLEHKREMFMGAKYAAATRGAHVVLIPRYGHVGYSELYNEKIAYLWLWAHKHGYFN